METNVIIELTTDFLKLMPKVPKSGGQILGQLPHHRVKNESDQIYKIIYIYKMFNIKAVLVLSKKYKNTTMKLSTFDGIMGL